ncbi:MAG: NAD-dependent epimerase/dehydratase family protein [Chitinophagales bacterium]
MILVTGGTGLVGSHLLRTLIKQEPNEPIRAIKRKSSKMDLVEDIAHQINWLDVDLLAVADLRKAMKEVSKIYHCAAVIAFDSAQFEWMHRVNMEGTANVVNLALEEGVEKMVHVSSIAAIGRSERNNQVSEATKWEDSSYNSQYAISKYRAEMEAWRGIAEGLNIVIVNPSVILGEGRWDEGSSQLIAKAAKGMSFYPDGGTGFVDVKDVVNVMVELMESNITNERFILNGVNITYRDFLTQAALVFHKSPPRFKVPSWLASLSWRLAKPLSWISRKPPLITKETAQLMQLQYFYDNSKIQKMAGFEFRPLKDTLQRIAGNFVLKNKS